MTDLRANLAEAWTRIPPDVRDEGRDWWPSAAHDIAGLGIRFGVPFTRLTYCAAALSPGIPWSGVMDTLELLLCALRDYEDMPRGSGHLTFGYRGRERAWGILTTGDTSLCRGPKVIEVASALQGEADAVPVDRHLIRAATGRDVAQVSPKQMSVIAEATREVAHHSLEEARAIQASIWLVGSRNVVRRRKES